MKDFCKIALSFPDGFFVKGIIAALKHQLTDIGITFHKEGGIDITERTKEETFVIHVHISTDDLQEYMYIADEDKVTMGFRLSDLYQAFKPVKRNMSVTWVISKDKKGGRITLLTGGDLGIKRLTKENDEYSAKRSKIPMMNKNIYKCPVDKFQNICQNTINGKHTLIISSLNYGKNSDKKNLQGIKCRQEDSMGDDAGGIKIQRDTVPGFEIRNSIEDDPFQITLSKVHVKTLSNMGKWSLAKSPVKLCGARRGGGYLLLSSSLGSYGKVTIALKNDPQQHSSNISG